MSVRDTTPPIVMANNNVTNLGIVGYLWDSPAADRKPLCHWVNLPMQLVYDNVRAAIAQSFKSTINLTHAREKG